MDMNLESHDQERVTRYINIGNSSEGFLTMNNQSGLLGTANVRPDGEIWNRQDKPQGVARFEAGDQTYWFSYDILFDVNGNDFWVVIKHFGFLSRDAAGNKDGLDRQRFTSKQAEAISRRLSEYYQGDEDKLVFPFKHRGTRFLGLRFGENWILAT
jgi:hypothetical protein